jgi:spermidine synthase
MDSAHLALRRPTVVAALVPLFITSGATSLVYETLWERQLQLVVGTSQVAVVTVLASFMAGLAAGGFLAGRVADRVRRPLYAYAALEGFIGLYALAFPLVLGAVEPLYLSFWRALEPSPLVFAVFQFLMLGLALLPPTLCMGATLPLLARFATADGSAEAGQQVGRLYGANTLGAVVGVGMAGFVLLPNLGLQLTTFTTAAGNVLLCGAALALGAWAGPLDAPSTAEASPGAAPARVPGWMRALGGLAFLAGLSSLIYEVAWFRLMVLTLGGSAYAFSTMLLSFLLGLGSGGWVGGHLADRAYARGGPAGALRLAAGLQLGVAAIAWLMMWTWNELPWWFVALYDAVESAPGYLWPAKVLLAIGILVPPTLLMGMSFPVLVRAATTDLGAVGGTVGRVYGWNTVGAILGALAGGLLLLPNIDIRGTSLFALSLNFVAALLAWRAAAAAAGARPNLGLQVGAAFGAAGVVGLVFTFKPPWEPLLMTAGMYKYVSDLSPENRTRAGVYAFAVEPYNLLFYDEGLSSVVTVAQGKDSENIWLANNGKVDASTEIDLPTQVLVAHLPFVFEPEAKEVLVIGLASGITAGSVRLHTGPSSIEIVELEPAIVEASHFFDAHNHRPLADPRVRLIANDGRNHLVLQPEGRYDLIVSEPPNPWLTGVSNLFTHEFFVMGKSKLKPGGVWSQWVQMYGMDREDLRSLLRTFSEVYPHVHLFSTIEDADLVLVGSDEPLDLRVDTLQAMLDRDVDVALDLQQVDCATPEDILTRHQMNRDGILAFAGTAERNTDDNMRIEYRAPLHLHDDTAEDNFRALLEGAQAEDDVPLFAVDGVDGRLDLAEAYARRGDFHFSRAVRVLEDAERLAPEDPRIFERITAYRGAYQRWLTDDGEDDGADDAAEAAAGDATPAGVPPTVTPAPAAP